HGQAEGEAPWQCALHALARSRAARVQRPCCGAGVEQQLAVRPAPGGGVDRRARGMCRRRTGEPTLHEHGHRLAFPSMATSWIAAPAGAADGFADIRYEKSAPPEQGIAKITIARPEVRNAFRPRTIVEISRALEQAREDTEIGVVVLTGEGPEAFCSGGDQRVRGDSGYLAEDQSGPAAVGRFHVTDLHVQIRRLPKPVVAMVAGYAIGGGHVLHLVCDLTI